MKHQPKQQELAALGPKDDAGSFMARAIELSVKNAQTGSGGPFGAVIVRQGRIIAEGTNTVTSAQDPTAHAEIEAIRSAARFLGNFSLAGCDIYTSCEPCPMCFSAIHWARLQRIFYANTAEDAARIGFDDALLYKELLLPQAKRRLKARQLMRDEALKAFQLWESKTDKIPY